MKNLWLFFVGRGRYTQRCPKCQGQAEVEITPQARNLVGYRSLVNDIVFESKIRELSEGKALIEWREKMISKEILKSKRVPISSELSS